MKITDRDQRRFLKYESPDDKRLRELQESPTFRQVPNIEALSISSKDPMSGHAALAMVLPHYDITTTPEGLPLTPQTIHLHLLEADSEYATENGGGPSPLNFDALARLVNVFSKNQLEPLILGKGDYDGYLREHPRLLRGLAPKEATEMLAFDFLRRDILNGNPVIIRPGNYFQVAVGIDPTFPTVPRRTEEMYLVHDPFTPKVKQPYERISLGVEWSGLTRSTEDRDPYKMLRIRNRVPRKGQ